MRATLPPAFAQRPRGAALASVLVVWIAATVVLSVALSPLVHALVESVAPGAFPFARVVRRVAMLVAVATFFVVGRWLDAHGFAAIGLAPARDRLRAALACLAIGFGGIAVLFAIELGAGTRGAGGGLEPLAALEVLIGAALVGLLEEGLLRGALLFPFGRLRGAALAGAATAISALYATAHFARGAPRGGQADWHTAWRLWAELPARAADHPEAWLGLFATGALFYVLAYRQGHAWGAAGLHAGAVLALQWGGALTAPVAGDDSLLLVDGLLPGYGVAAVAAVAAVVLLVAPSRARR